MISDHVLDNGLEALRTGATRVNICSAEPTSYAQAGTLSLGNKTGITMGALGAATPSGRKSTMPAITDGTVTANGTATHFALLDPANSRLLATKAISNPQAVTSGNPWTSGAVDFTMREAS